MERRVFIGFLLVCCVAGFPAEEAHDLFDETEHLSLNKLTDKLPDALTDLSFKQLPHVYDDDENLVLIELDKEYAEKLTDNSMAERVIFQLYTRKSSKHPELIYVDDDVALNRSYFDPSKPTRFVTHGWYGSGRREACTLVRDAYLKYDDCNVIVIDWSSISSFGPYIWVSSRSTIQKVANYLSKLLDFLVMKGMDSSQTVLAGHSLGAHVVGIGARNAKKEIAYVVGLDPAGPNFEFSEAGARISKGDATYVEIIHTNAGYIDNLGLYPAIGDADFYPNGGSWQPGCFSKICSHARSYEYFAESINSEKKFLSTKCANYKEYIWGMCKMQPRIEMGGLNPKLDTKGTFYLTTNSKSPYVMDK